MSVRPQRGYSLIELLMVTAVVIILAALVYFFAISAKSRADEVSAVESIRAIEAAEFQYAARHPESGYNSLDKLPLSDPALKSGYKHGYEFIVTLDSGGAGAPNTRFQVTAMPVGLNELLAARTYYADESGTITFARGREPSSASLKVNPTKSQWRR
jgi:type IV pilus assembly protein PilA